MNGRFISFEGPEGAGKSTQIRALVEFLQRRGIQVETVREPGGTPTGEMIRGILQHDTTGEPVCPETELLLFEASRAQLVRRVIEPALAAGRWVISDRFMDSTTTYQGYGRGFPIATVLDINRFAVGATAPDLTILLDLDIGAGLARVARRNTAAGCGADRMEREADAFHERVRRGYLQLARRCPGRIVVVDAARDPGEVTAEVRRIVVERLGVKP